MNMKHAVGLLLTLIFVLQIIAISGNSGTTQIPVSSRETNGNTESLIISPVEYKIAGAYGEDPILTNHATNPSFEKVDENKLPTDWNCYGSGYTAKNSTFEDIVHSGSRAGQMICEGTSSWGTSVSWGRSYSSCYLTNDISFEFYYHINSISDPDLGGYFYVGHSIYTGSAWRNMYYFLSHSSSYSPGNNSNNVYFLMDSTSHTWNNLSRSITDDYENYFGAASGSTYLSYSNWNVYSTINPDDKTEIILDDITVYDSGLTEYVTDGDFELGGSSWDNSRTSPATIQESFDSTDGVRSTNATISAIDDNFSGYTYISRYFGNPQGLIADEPDSLFIEFDWKYDDTWNGGGQEAYMYLNMQNQTHNKALYMLLGSDMDTYYVSNDSYSCWLFSENYGSRGVWQHESIDVAELRQECGITEMAIIEIVVYTQIGARSNSTITLLLDDMKILSYPTCDPGFEADFFWTTDIPICGWNTYSNGYPYLNHTTDSHTGRYAANFTTSDGVQRYVGVSRSTFLPVEMDLYTDMWWRLDEIGSGTMNIAQVDLQLNYGEKTLSYVLAGGSIYSNSTNYFYYLVENISITGQWFNLVRNVYSDISEAFGTGNWNITHIAIYAANQPSENLVVIIDDVHFIRDTHAPVLTQVSGFPINPMYYESVALSIEATDLSGVSGSLFYNNGTSWNSVIMTNLGDHFEVVLPPLPFGTNVMYYVNLTDPCENWAIYDNSSFYYSYMIDDDVNPTVSIVNPHDSDIIDGWITITVNADDPGVGSSGIDYVELWVDGAPAGSIHTYPYEFTGNSRLAENGTTTLEVRAYDYAGNWASDSIIVDVQNDFQGPILSIIEINPTTPIVGEDVTISLAVTDQTGVDNVTLYYRVPLGMYQEIIMDSSGPLYFATISAQMGTDTIEYYIVAYDVFGQDSTAGNPSSPLTFNIITDISIPVISNVHLTPEIPVYGQTISVSACVTAATTLQSVLLNYKVGDASWTEVAMILSGNQFIGQIPAAPWNTEVLYYIVATDDAAQIVSYGNETSPRIYTVADLILPTLTVTGPAIVNAIRGNVSFYVSGTDTGSGIAHAALVVNGTSVWSSTALPAVLIWNTIALPNGNYTITFILEDNAGNVATITFDYMIANPDIFGSIGEEIGSFMQSYGFFVGAITFVVLLAAVKIVSRRRS